MFTKVCSSQWALYFNFYLASPTSQTNTLVEHYKSLAADLGTSHCFGGKKKVTPGIIITCLGLPYVLKIALKILILYYLTDIFKIFKIVLFSFSDVSQLDS